MKSIVFTALTMLFGSAVLLAVDGNVLINQSTVMAAGGFPYTIAQPGSYRLSGNLIAPPSVNAIQISADGVTLDLNGFTVSCSVLLPNTVRCISETGDFHNISVQNGVVKGTIAGGTAAGSPGVANLIGVYLSSERNTIDNLRVDVPIANFPSPGGVYYSISTGGNSRVRHNVLNGSGFVQCPSVVVENIHPTGANTAFFFFGAGCASYGNVGFSAIP
jgi:hypothetical protein